MGATREGAALGGGAAPGAGAPRLLDHETAATYAAWFKALSDPTRVRILNLLAVERRPMSVGEIVRRSDVGQSTVSHHLRALAEVRFVLSERRSTSVWYEVNHACLACFPSAVDAVMGHPAPVPVTPEGRAR